MAEERVQRRLAAILAADVVGYSQHMGEDEAGTRSKFNECLDLALLVDRQHDGMGRGGDIEPEDVPELVDELRIVGELEPPPAMGLRSMGRAPSLRGTCHVENSRSSSVVHSTVAGTN